jgi:hypothetical protein
MHRQKLASALLEREIGVANRGRVVDCSCSARMLSGNGHHVRSTVHQVRPACPGSAADFDHGPVPPTTVRPTRARCSHPARRAHPDRGGEAGGDEPVDRRPDRRPPYIHRPAGGPASMSPPKAADRLCAIPASEKTFGPSRVTGKNFSNIDCRSRGVGGAHA